MLTTDQVQDFLVHKIGFKDWEALLAADKTEFLVQFCRSFQKEIYYENITWGAMSDEERKLPTREDCITQILETPGGSCMQLNYFVKALLESVGFQTFICDGSIRTSGLPGDHILCIVQWSSLDNPDDATPENVWLVDVGYARCLVSPINLKQLPHRAVEAGFKVEYEYNLEEKVYKRILLTGCPIKGPLEPGHVDYKFDLTPKEFEDFRSAHQALYVDPSAGSFFLNTILIFRFVELNSPLEYEFVMYFGRKRIRGTANERTVDKFETYIEMMPDIMKWFPRLDPVILRKALLNYDERQAKRGGEDASF